MTLYKALTLFIQIWVGLVFAANITAVLFGVVILKGIFMNYSPPLYEFVLLSPALGAYFWRGFLKSN